MNITTQTKSATQIYYILDNTVMQVKRLMGTYFELLRSMDHHEYPLRLMNLM